MSYIHPRLSGQFETLSPQLKGEILKRDVEINSLQDLVKILEVIVAEEDA